MTHTLLNLIADTHSGHRVGLFNPDTKLFDEGENGQPVPYPYEPTAVQRYLWELYLKNRKTIADLNLPTTVFLVGDLGWGDKYPQQLVSTRKADQYLIAEKVLQPAIERETVKHVRINVGTQAHTFGEGTAEIIICELLKKDYPTKDIQVLYHGLAEVNGMPVDYAHHGPPPGKRHWLTGNEARYHLRDLMDREIMAGKIPPRLYVRAHFHDYVEETVTIRVGTRIYRSTIIILPSYDMLTDHVRQSCKSPGVVTNGEVVCEIVDGELYKIHPLISVADVRTREVLA